MKRIFVFLLSAVVIVSLVLPISAMSPKQDFPPRYPTTLIAPERPSQLDVEKADINITYTEKTRAHQLNVEYKVANNTDSVQEANLVVPVNVFHYENYNDVDDLENRVAPNIFINGVEAKPVVSVDLSREELIENRTDIGTSINYPVDFDEEGTLYSFPDIFTKLPQALIYIEYLASETLVYSSDYPVYTEIGESDEVVYAYNGEPDNRAELLILGDQDVKFSVYDDYERTLIPSEQYEVTAQEGVTLAEQLEKQISDYRGNEELLNLNWEISMEEMIKTAVEIQYAADFTPREKYNYDLEVNYGSFQEALGRIIQVENQRLTVPIKLLPHENATIVTRENIELGFSQRMRDIYSFYTYVILLDGNKNWHSLPEYSVNILSEYKIHKLEINGVEEDFQYDRKSKLYSFVASPSLDEEVLTLVLYNKDVESYIRGFFTGLAMLMMITFPLGPIVMILLLYLLFRLIRWIVRLIISIKG